MIELYLAILLFGAGTYLGSTKRPVLKNMEVLKEKAQNNVNNGNNVNNSNKKRKKNLVVYAGDNKKNVEELEKEYGKQLDSKCREILPRDFTGILNKKSQKEYEKRKLSELNYTNEVDNEILKYEPKESNTVKSKLTGTDIPIETFTRSSTVAKDGSGEDATMNNWALPYFGGKATQPMNVEGFQNKLDVFTGSSQYNHHKKEIKPLFAPSSDVNFVNGTPIYEESRRDRFVQSNMRNTELPFEQTRVGRGVGQDYGNKGKGGFHQFEIQDIAKPKSVDELRVLSNPKTTYKQPVISGKGIDGRSADVNLAKNRPDKFYTNSPSRYLKTTGAILKGKSDEKFILKNTGRSISRQLVGSASPAANVKTYKTPNFKRSTRNNYVNTGLRNKYLSEGWDQSGELSDYGKKSIKLGPNERDVTQSRRHTLNLVEAVKAIVAPLQDKIKKTRKENFIGNPNPEGYMSTSMPNKQTVYDPNDIARTTIKETTLAEATEQNLTGPKKQTAYDPNDIAKTTVKETTLAESPEQNLTGPKKQTVYDPNDIARTTIKETTIHNKTPSTIKGPIKVAVYDPNDIAKTTIKETTIDNNHTGYLSDTGPKKSLNYSVESPKTTLKETTIDNIHHSNVNYSRGDGYGYMSNKFDAPATQKQSTSDVEYSGNVHSEVNNKGGYTSNEFYAPPTQKESTSDNEYTGAANSYSKATQDYGAAKNMITNALKEKVAKGRSFTQHGSKKFNGEEYMNVLFKKQNAKIDYQKQSNVSNIRQKIVGKEISAPSSQRVPLSNQRQVETVNPANLSQLNDNPYALSINRQVVEEYDDYTTEEEFS
mgnify:CR=1 FL=1